MLPYSKTDIGDMDMPISVARGIWWKFSMTLRSSPSIKKKQKDFYFHPYLMTLYKHAK
jgi:hypothetical protein